MPLIPASATVSSSYSGYETPDSAYTATGVYDTEKKQFLVNGKPVQFFSNLKQIGGKSKSRRNRKSNKSKKRKSIKSRKTIRRR